MTRLLIRVVTPLLTVFAATTLVLGIPQSTGTSSFEDKLYSIAQVTPFATDPQILALTEDDKADLLSCRNVLVEFFRQIHKNASVAAYITPALAKKYANETAMADALIAPETAVLYIGVVNVRIVERQARLRLDFFVVMDSEGMIVA